MDYMENWGKDRNAFHRRDQMYGTWLEESEEERRLRTIAEDYHHSCDAYDRRICSGVSPRTGEAMPVTPQEMGLINRHARQFITEIAKYEGFTEERVVEAIRKYKSR